MYGPEGYKYNIPSADDWFYDLDEDRNPIRVMNLVRDLGSQRLRVGDTAVGLYRIATSFLGFADSFEDNQPLLFETMVFVEDRAVFSCKWTTWDKAAEGHEKVVGLFSPGGSGVL